MRLSPLAPLFVALLASLPCAVATAAPPPAHDDVYTIARKHFDEGARLFELAQERGDPALYERAYAEFRVAYDAHTTTHGVWNLIYAEVATRRFADAMGHLREWKRLDAAGTDPSKKSTAAEHAQIAKVWSEAFATTAHVTIEAPKDALVRIDEHALPQRAPLPDPIDLAPGRHTFSARLGDAELPGRSLDVQAGNEVTLSFAVATGATGPSAAPAHVVASEPPSPPTSRSPAAPPVAPARDASPYLTPRRVAGLATGGAGVVALVVSGILAGRSNSDAASADATVAQSGSSLCPSSPMCADVTGERQAQGQERTWSIATGAVGFAALAAGAALFLWPSREADHGASPSATLVPFGTARGAGFVLQGSL